MNLQSIVDQARMRNNAVAELKHVIDELDEQTLQRILVYAVDRLERFSHGDPRIKLVRNPDGTPQTTQLEEAILYKKEQAKEQAKRITRAEKGVRTRKANAAKKKAEAGTSIRGSAIVDALKSDPKAGISVKDICAQTQLSISNVYAQLKKLGAYSNGQGLWWANKKTYLARFPIAGRGKKAVNKLANGAAEKAP